MAAEQPPYQHVNDDAVATYRELPLTVINVDNLQANNSYDDDTDLDMNGGDGKSNSLRFIHINQPSEINTQDNRRLVRSTVMRSFRQRQRCTPARTRGPSTLPSIAQPPMAGSGQHTAAQANPYGVLVPQSFSDGSGGNRERKAEHRQTYRELRKYVDEDSVRSPNELPGSILGAGRIDPFMSYAVQHHLYVDEFIDHFANVLAPSHIPIAGSLNPLVTRLIPYGREHAVVLHALLAVSGAHLTVMKGGQAPNELEMYHRGETFRLLNILLSDCERATSDVVVAAILNVSGYDVLFGLHDAHELHMKGLDRIIQLRGGAENLGLEGLLEKQVTWSNHFRAMRRSSPGFATAVEENTSNIVGPLKSARSYTTDTESAEKATIPLGFQQLVNRGCIGIILARLMTLMHSLARELQEHLGINVPEEHINLFSNRRHALEIKLDTFRESLRGSTEGSIEECVCLAALIFDHSTIRQMPLASFTLVTLSKELKLAVARTDLTESWGLNYESLVWVCFLASATTINLSEKYWYAELLGQIVSSTQPKLDWATINDVLNKFLWSHRYNLASEEIWALVRTHPEANVPDQDF